MIACKKKLQEKNRSLISSKIKNKQQTTTLFINVYNFRGVCF